MKDVRGRITAALGNAGARAAPDRRSVAIGLVKPAYDAVRWANVPGPPSRDLPAVRSLLGADAETQVLALGILVDWIAEGRSLGTSEPAEPLFGLLVTQKPAIGPEALAALLERYREALFSHGWAASQLLKHVARLTRDVVPTYAPDDQARLQGPIAGVLAALAEERWLTPAPSVVAMLRGLLPDVAFDPERIPAHTNVGQALRAVVVASTEDPEPLGAFVVRLVTPMPKARPSDAWLTETRELAGRLADGPGLVRTLLEAIVEVPDSVQRGQGWEHPTFDSHAEDLVVRACIWAAAALGDVEAIPMLRALAIKGVEMIGGQYGKPRSMGIAQACPAATGTIGGPAALAALQQLQRSTRHGTILRETAKAIDALAAAGGMTASELLETSVETHGLDADGTRSFAISDARATLALDPSGEVTLTWTNAAGKTVASLPKAVRDAHPEAFAEVTATAKALRATVAGERTRLDGLFVQDRRWSLAGWRERYLDHPVTGTLVRGLIWRFRTGDAVRDGMPLDAGTATDATGVPFPIDTVETVELWHPVLATTDEILAWRTRLLAENRRQPLKQAFRELYLLTPAELATATYSSRFASHVIRQAQARALMKGRGWKPVALAWWDDGIDHGVARRTYDAHRLRAEFFYDPITDLQDSGNLWPYCTTDQVAFFDITTDRRVHLRDVPALLFSEAMRDVDLFVGVTSIGADPHWLDQGERRFDTYWHQWGFGELAQAGRIRHDVLASMLPGLVIADRCTLDERWLQVRGELHTYRIHLGSGNILMSPDDRYLCIVAERSAKPDARVHLPFDDDPVLSMILSKAFLLARDTAITDPTIVAQIHG